MPNSLQFEVNTSRKALEKLLHTHTDHFRIRGEYTLVGKNEWKIAVFASALDDKGIEITEVGLCPTPCPPNVPCESVRSEEL